MVFYDDVNPIFIPIEAAVGKNLTCIMEVGIKKANLDYIYGKNEKVYLIYNDEKTRQNEYS